MSFRVWLPSSVRWCISLVLGLLCGAVAAETSVATATSVAADAARQEFSESVQPILARVCFDCHGAVDPSADLDLTSLDPDLVNGDHLEAWHDVLERMNLGEMPPTDAEQPTAEERKIAVGWLTGEIERAAKARRNEQGDVLMRRLTRYEYQNTMRDLLGVNQNFAKELPPEPLSADGFLNDGATLEMAPAQLEVYLQAARRGLAEAIVSGPKPEVVRKRIEETEDGRLRSKMNVNHEPTHPEFLMKLDEFPQSGDFRLQVQAWAKVPDGHAYPRLRVSLGYHPGGGFVLRNTIDEVEITGTAEQPQNIVFRGRMEQYPQPSPNTRTKGSRDFPGMIVVFDFVDAAGRQLRHDGREYPGPEPRVKRDGTLMNYEPLPAGPQPDIFVDWAVFESPVFQSWPPASHRRLLPEAGPTGDEQQYVRKVLEPFMTRAFRRPVTHREVEELVRVFDAVRPRCETFEEAVRETFAAVLVSPHFLYIVEPRLSTPREEPLVLNDYELATRLSYFLWATMPDEELFQLAEQGKLVDPAVLEQQVQRMLADDRAAEFRQRFADQWFDLEALDRVAVNPEVFPDFDDSLKHQMKKQTRAFVSEVIRNNHSALDLIDSDWTMLNRALAKHYGMEPPLSHEFQRVSLPPGSHRGGLLGQASILLANSTGRESHPIKRAVWILDRLLASPPAPPPADVPDLDPDNPKLAKLTLKEQLEWHRDKPACANCHRNLDPWGIPLEEYNAIGLTHAEWAEQLASLDLKKRRRKPPKVQPDEVDASSVLPGGAAVSGPVELKQHLMNDRRDLFARAVVERLASYALGRQLGLADEAAVNELAREFLSDELRMKNLIIRLTKSELFRTK